MTNEEIISAYKKEVAELKEQVKQYRSFFKMMQEILKFTLLGCNACIKYDKSESDEESKD